MRIETRIFGEIEIADSKVICFPGGIIGFPELTDFALIYDEEKGENTSIRWLQSLQEANFAIPVMNPLLVAPEYNPQVEDELLSPLGGLNEDALVLVTVTVPKDLTRMSVNLQAPIIINAGSRKAAQVIVNTDIYPVKHYIYDTLQQLKKEGE